MSANESELQAIVGALQIDRTSQALRDERIEKELTEMRKSGANTEKNIAKMTNVLTRFMEKSQHLESDFLKMDKAQILVVDRLTLLEIKGQERDTKIMMIVAASAAAISGAIAWFVSKVGG